ncbi:unnamed protein product [Blepharisma stoltei]|uniref:Uncharacterized protein n=1 Tax=Blepharisma stoltei TaxID=1481888 RepID=A0AAU9IIM2_9CILI|nr:unnamed protein product [Blepharisma stoltei]
MNHGIELKTQKKVQNIKIQQELSLSNEKFPRKLNNFNIDEGQQPSQFTITFRNNSFNNQNSSTDPGLNDRESLKLEEISSLAIRVMITSAVNSLLCFIFAFSDIWPLVIIAFFPTIGYLGALRLSKKLLLAYMLIMAIINILRMTLIFRIKRYDYAGLALLSTLLSLIFMIWIIRFYKLLGTFSSAKNEEIADLLWNSSNSRNIEISIASNMQSSNSKLKSHSWDEFFKNKQSGTILKFTPSWNPLTP